MTEQNDPRGRPGTAVRAWIGRAAAWLWPGALAAAVFAASGRIGFNPSDEGLILAQARRIAAGAQPHVDLISPRPLGSALLHVPELWHPLPLLEASRWLALAQFVAITWVLAAFVLRRGPARWSFGEHVAVGAALLVNLHGWPLMAWHTLDGVLLVSLAWLGIARVRTLDLEHRRGAALALSAVSGVLLGLALTVKQSFAPAALLGFAWLAVRGAGASAATLAVAGTLPPLAYVAWSSVGAGFGPLATQLVGASPTYGESLVTYFATLPGAFGWLAVVCVGAASGWVASRRPERDPARRASALLLGATLVAILAFAGLPYLGVHGFWITWLALAFAVGSMAAAGAAAGERVLAVVALGWMTTLSWGSPTPNVVAGSLALALWSVAASVLPEPLARARVARAVGGVALAALFAFSANERRERPYADRRADLLVESLRDVAPGFGGIRTNALTAEYLREAKRCIADHPASRVALLPDNAALYPLLGLENPFPTDWFFSPEVVTTRDRLVERARGLAKEGDYLVLAQAVKTYALWKRRQLPDAGSTPSWFDRHPLGRAIAAELAGRRVTCGPFAGFHAPPAAGAP